MLKLGYTGHVTVVGLNIDSLFSQDLCFWIHGSRKRDLQPVFFKFSWNRFFFIKFSLYF